MVKLNTINLSLINIQSQKKNIIDEQEVFDGDWMSIIECNDICVDTFYLENELTNVALFVSITQWL